MNILYRDKRLLTTNITDVKHLLMFYQEHYYDNVYYTDNDARLNYYISLDGFIHKQQKGVEASLNCNVSSLSVNEWFVNNPGVFRVPVIDDYGILLGEYYDADSQGPCLYQSIEDKSLSILDCISSELKEWSKDKKIGLVGDSITKERLEKIFSCIVESDKCDVIIDMTLVPKFRKIAGVDGTNVLSLSEIIIPILIQKVLSFFYDKGVHVCVVNGILKSELKTLSSDSKLSKSIEEVLHDSEYIKCFCGDDQLSYSIIEKHVNDLNQVSRVVSNGIHNMLVDHIEEGYNIVNGERFSEHVPTSYVNTIHFYGPCIIQGLCVADKYTIPSIVQENINRDQSNYASVENHGVSYGKDLLNDLLCMMSTPVRRGDIIVWMSGFDRSEKDTIERHGISIIDSYTSLKQLKNWYLDNPFHCNSTANKLISSLIYDSIKASLYVVQGVGERVSLIEKEHLPLSIKTDAILDSTDLKQYVYQLKEARFNDDSAIKGCVVIYANPCTNGHLYLINKALEAVDYLYVLLVEEKSDYFSFLDREYMLRENFKDNKRVKILSGGRVLTGKVGFPEYFDRHRDVRKMNPLLNHRIFATKVAPALGITKRFFGSEPIDKVTNLLMVTAQTELPKYGIEVLVIERCKIGNTYISAKTVRQLFEEHNYKELEKMVPYSTLTKLRELDSNPTN